MRLVSSSSSSSSSSKSSVSTKTSRIVDFDSFYPIFDVVPTLFDDYDVYCGDDKDDDNNDDKDEAQPYYSCW